MANPQPTLAELRALIPKDKHDLERAQALIKLGYPAVAPILAELLVWMQDLNWPVARELQPFISSIGEPLAPHLREIFSTDDDAWKYSMLVYVMHYHPALVRLLAPELRRMASSPTPGEHVDQVDIEARGLLLREHVREHLGPIAMETSAPYVTDATYLDSLFIPPTSDCPYLRVVTSGMSVAPMRMPEELSQSESPRHIELMLTLPADWPMLPEAMENEENYWPYRLLIDLARYPTFHKTWLGHGRTVSNGETYGPHWSGALIAAPTSLPPGFNPLCIGNAPPIEFLSVIPLYEEEMRVKSQHGAQALFERLVAQGVGYLIEAGRVNVAK